MKQIYQTEYLNFQLYYKKKFLVTMILFFTMTLVGLYIASMFPNFIEAFSESRHEKLEEIGVRNSTGFALMIAILKNNIIATLVILLVGFVPYLSIPYIYTSINGIVIGFLLNNQLVKDISLLKVVSFGLVPHGVTELTALFLSASIGLYICRSLSRKLMRCNDTQKYSEVLRNSIRTYLIVVLPLLLISSFIEAFISHYLVTKYL